MSKKRWKQKGKNKEDKGLRSTGNDKEEKGTSSDRKASTPSTISTTHHTKMSTVVKAASKAKRSLPNSPRKKSYCHQKIVPYIC